ncbi:MAG TPA: methyltransferase domain-containing protein [Candidatus Limnocylindria bacterium]|nr:methyltransferase domain-containing protein [Candidatus Limnocylindria bacterium]
MSKIGPVQRQFGRTAAAYVDSATHARGEDLDRIVALAREHGGERLVDVGTGVGHTLRRVAPSFGAAIGVDATREMLKAGQTVLEGAGVANALLVQADATALPIASRSVDVVTSRLAAHHFADAAAAFREIGRILRAGGLFILVDNFAPDDPALDTFINELETLRDPSHVRNHSVQGWRELLERAGLRATVDSDTAVTKLTTVDWLERSQTPPDRAEEVRRRLRMAPAAAVDAFQITPVTFAVRKLILIGRK